jgi:hypothetical protein
VTDDRQALRTGTDSVLNCTSNHPHLPHHNPRSRVFSLQRSSSLRQSLGNYLDDYGSGPEDAAAANGINL